jgi:xanthine dehydrogenase large subunit
MNQARALVHVYTDGSIAVSTGAVEMGQGVNTKILQVAASAFSVSAEHIKVHSTSTLRIANTSPSAASATADLNGQAVQLACNAICARLKDVAAESLDTGSATIELRNGYVWNNGQQTEIDWKKLVTMAFVKRIALSEHAHYSTPGIHYDATVEKGNPFAYHVYGTALTTVKVDCLRGIYELESVRIVHDIGSGMHEAIDRGQIEGGLVQGIGWMTIEEVIFDKEGRLRSDALSTYKVPDIYSVPKEIDIHFLRSYSDNKALLGSKAVGEPPLMYGIGTFFALRNAIKSYNPHAEIAFSSPFTPEKVLLALYDRCTEVKIKAGDIVYQV